MLLRNLHARHCLTDGSNELRCSQRKNFGTAVSCSLTCNSSPFVLLHVRFSTIFDVMQSSKCFALMFLFGLASLTELSVGSTGTNPSTTL
jgi:hypothetical protein